MAPGNQEKSSQKGWTLWELLTRLAGSPDSFFFFLSFFYYYYYYYHFYHFVIRVPVGGNEGTPLLLGWARTMSTKPVFFPLFLL